MAVQARSGSMRAYKREIRLRVIEARQLFPRFRGVAAFATCGLAVQSGAEHAFPELPFMGIGVAGRAIKFLPVVDRGLFFAGLNQAFMTVSAGGRHVAAGEHETRLLVTSQ